MFDGEMTQEEVGRALTRALQVLAASGDQEAFDALKKARETGRLEMTREQAQQFIDRAKQGGGGGGGAAKEEPPKKPDLEKVKKARKAGLIK